MLMVQAYSQSGKEKDTRQGKTDLAAEQLKKAIALIKKTKMDKQEKKELLQHHRTRLQGWEKAPPNQKSTQEQP